MSTNLIPIRSPEVTLPVEPEKSQLALKSRVIQVVEGALALIVNSPETHDAAGDTLTAVKILLKEWKTVQGPEKETAYRLYDEELQKYNSGEKPLLAAESHLKRVIQTYEDQQEVLRRQKEAELNRKLEADAQAEAVQTAQAQQIDAAIQAAAEGDQERAEQIMNAPAQILPPVYAGTVSVAPVVSKIAGSSRRSKVIVELRNARGVLVYSSDKDAGLADAEIHRCAEYADIPDAFWVLDTAALKKQGDATRELTAIPRVTVRIGSGIAMKV